MPIERSGSKKVVVTTNVWTDEAREASIEARRAHAKASSVSSVLSIPDAIAEKGATLADSQMSADRNMEDAMSARQKLQYSKLKRDKKLLPEAIKKDEEAEKVYHAAVAESAAFEKEHGVSVVHAWEAHNDRDWPHYRVQTNPESRRFTTETKFAVGRLQGTIKSKG